MAVDGSTDSRPNHLVVVGASAGGINALIALASALEPDVDAAVLVVLHMGATARTVLDQVMSRAGPLPARLAVHGEPIRRAEILIAPPDHHLLVDDGTVRLTRGPRIGGLRPSVDELFRSAASSAGARVIGVVLSGTLDDGSAGGRGHPPLGRHGRRPGPG